MESLAIGNFGPAVYSKTLNLGNTVKRANSFLIFRQFDQCLMWCCKNINNLQNYTDDESSKEVLDSLVVIAIQAFAELNRWLEVLPFVSQTYNGLEDCPSLVAKLCLLLHANLKDHVTCTVLMNIWLKNPSNFSSPDYQMLAELYVERVLIPSQRWNDVRPFLDSCPGLDELVKLNYSRKVNDIQRKQVESSTDTIEIIEKPCQDQQSTSVESGVLPYDADKIASERPGILPSYLKRVLDYLKTYFRKYHLPLYLIRGLCFVAVFVYLFFAKWNAAVKLSSSSASLTRLLSILEMLWRGMFAPFYAVNK